MFEEVIAAEATIKSIRNSHNQDEIRVLVNKKYNNLLKNNYNQKINNLKVQYKEDTQNLKNIKNKLKNNNGIILKADKGNTTVIMDRDTYTEKTYTFINNNNIKRIIEDPTEKFHTDMNKAISNCVNLFDYGTRLHIKQINPQAPVMTGLPKIHKENTPIRPLINFKTAPGYKAAKKLEKIIKNNIILNNNMSIKNNDEFIEKITKIKISKQLKIASFDVVNMYTNIPINETIDILHNNLMITKKLDIIKIRELISLVTTILKQNYFTFNNEFFIQEEGLGMGSPLSGLLSEIYLNHFENKYLLNNNNVFHKNIIFYGRYIDDSIILFDGTKRQIDHILNYLNKQNKIKFTVEHEIDNSINFLDLNITLKNNKIKFKIYRKPTTTDTTINAQSFHPHSHKMSAYHSYVHRLLNTPLDDDDYHDELNTIKYIAQNNGYNTSIIDKIVRKHKQKTRVNTSYTDNNRRYVSATYSNLMPLILHNTFIKFDRNISFKTNNNIYKQLINDVSHIKKQIYEKTGIYKLKCNDCDKFYLGQTGRPFYIRYKEHLPTKNLTNIKSNFARHIVNNGHKYSNINNNLEPIHICSKGQYMNAIEEFEIYRNFKTHPDIILNDQLKFNSHQLYDTAITLLTHTDM